MIRNTNQEELENMKATGIVRRVDELGRLVIPKGNKKNYASCRRHTA